MVQVVVLKVDFHDEKTKTKIRKTAAGQSGVVSIAMSSKDTKLTVTGDIDPVSLVNDLRKLCSAHIYSVIPPKAPEMKEKPKKPEQVVVLKVDFHDDGTRPKIMKTAAGHAGVVSIAMNSKDTKLTLTGDIDAVSLVNKLRRKKLCSADIYLKEKPKKPEQDKKDPKKEPKKPEQDKKDPKKEPKKPKQDKKDPKKEAR